MLENILWTEKYRPTNIADLAIPERLMKILSQGLTQNLLLFGTAGTGKTTTAKAICKTFNIDYIYINGSSETGVDTIRNKIMDFVSSQSLGIFDEAEEENKLKCVIIDEADMMSTQAFGALRATVEQYHSIARFIMTCNYIDKIPEPIKSRFQMIDFNVTGDEIIEVKRKIIKRISKICEDENLNIDISAINKLQKLLYPDFRKMVSQLQQLKQLNKEKITETDISKYDSLSTELYTRCISKNISFLDNRKWLMSNFGSIAEDALFYLGDSFICWIESEHSEFIGKLPKLAICVADYQHDVKNTVDPKLTLLACFVSIQGILNGEL